MQYVKWVGNFYGIFVQWCIVGPCKTLYAEQGDARLDNERIYAMCEVLYRANLDETDWVRYHMQEL